MKWSLCLVLLFGIAAPAEAAQSSFAYGLPTSSPYPGLTMLGNINSAFGTFDSNFAGSLAPSGAVSYQFWVNTTSSILEFTPDGTTWLPVGSYSGGSQWMPFSNGVPATIPASTGSSNAYVVTYSPAVTAYVAGQHYPFIANFQDTGAATENVNGLGSVPLKKFGSTALASGDIGIGLVVDDVYDGTNMQITSQLSNSASGTVTSVGCGTGLAGGTITTSGTCSLGTISNQSVMANISGSTAVPSATSLTALIDAALGDQQGDILFRGTADWTVLTPGSAGQFLETGGSGANVSWATGSGGLTLLATVNASGASSVSFGSTYITTSYNKYILEFDGVYTSDGGPLYLTVSTNNGSSYLSSGYYAEGPVWNNGTLTLGESSNGGYIDLGILNGTTSSTSTKTTAGTVKFSNLAQSVQASITWTADFGNAAGYSFNNNFLGPGIGRNWTTTAINAIKITDGTGGNITGNFHLYGIQGN